MKLTKAQREQRARQNAVGIFGHDQAKEREQFWREVAEGKRRDPRVHSLDDPRAMRFLADLRSGV